MTYSFVVTLFLKKLINIIAHIIAKFSIVKSIEKIRLFFLATDLPSNNHS